MGDWKNGLCSCFDNINLCLITSFVPFVTAGQNAEAVGESCFLYGLLSSLWPIGIYTDAMIRRKIREQKGIEGDFWMDFLLHAFLPCCALIQEGQEVGTSADAIAREEQCQELRHNIKATSTCRLESSPRLQCPDGRRYRFFTKGTKEEKRGVKWEPGKTDCLAASTTAACASSHTLCLASRPAKTPRQWARAAACTAVCSSWGLSASTPEPRSGARSESRRGSRVVSAWIVSFTGFFLSAL